MEVKPHYIHTELGIIPNTWKIVHLQDVIDKVIDNRGKTPPLSNNGFPLLEVSVFTNKNKPELGKVSKYVDSKTFHSWFRSGHPKCNDIIVPTVGTIGTAAIIDRDGLCIAQNVVGLQIKPENDPYYILCQIKSDSFVRQIKAVMMSAVQPSLKVPYLLTSKLLIPRFEEQQKIAECIGNIDSLITSLEKLIEKKKNIKQGMMQELLTGKRRLPGFTGKWETKKLGELANLYQPQTISQDVFTDGGYNVWGANGIIGKFNKYNHKNWQTTISCRGNCGSVNKTDHPCWITGNAMVVNVDNNQCINKLFLYYKLSSLDFSDLITGSGQPQIVRGPLSIYNLDLPILVEEQKAIASILHCMDKDIAINTEKLFKYQKLKQGIMQELLTGRIRLV